MCVLLSSPLYFFDRSINILFRIFFVHCSHFQFFFLYIGTFITIDISIQRLDDRNRIDIKKTVEKIRLQRAYSIQMPDQYVFCCLAVLEYAMWKGLLENVNLTKFEESDQSDTDGD